MIEFFLKNKSLLALLLTVLYFMFDQYRINGLRQEKDVLLSKYNVCYIQNSMLTNSITEANKLESKYRNELSIREKEAKKKQIESEGEAKKIMNEKVSSECEKSIKYLIGKRNVI
jgi:hypothetical protein